MNYYLPHNDLGDDPQWYLTTAFLQSSSQLVNIADDYDVTIISVVMSAGKLPNMMIIHQAKQLPLVSNYCLSGEI